MSFGIHFNIEFTYDPDTNKFFLNGIEITPEDISFINTYHLDLFDAVKNNYDIELTLSPQVLELIEKKYYKN